MTAAVREAPSTVMPVEFEIALAARKYLKRQAESAMTDSDNGDLCDELLAQRFGIQIIDNGDDGIHGSLSDEAFEKAATAFYDTLVEEVERDGVQSALEMAARIMVQAVMDFAAQTAFTNSLEDKLEHIDKTNDYAERIEAWLLKAPSFEPV